MALKLPDKDPDEVLDYDVDFAQWVTSPATIQAVGTSVALDGVSSPSGDSALVVDTVIVGSNIVAAWLSAGTAGETYTLKVEAVDNNSPVRTVVRRVKIKVKEK